MDFTTLLVSQYTAAPVFKGFLCGWYTIIGAEYTTIFNCSDAVYCSKTVTVNDVLRFSQHHKFQDCIGSFGDEISV